MMSKSRALPMVMLVAAFLFCAYFSLSTIAPTAFLGSIVATADDTDAEVEERTGFRTPLDWLHYDVILKSRKAYPVALMIGFCCFGNVLLRKECGGKPYPNWMFGWILGFICYGYPGAIFSDLIFLGETPRAMSNDNILFVFTFFFVLIQNNEAAYKFLSGNKHVQVWLFTWWLADAQRASLCFLERAVAKNPVFARAVFQSFVWCTAGPLVRVVEACIRGAPVPALDKLLPNSLNPLKWPLVAMWMVMMGYTGYMMFFTDCNLFGEGEKLTMVECGDKHEDAYAFFVYLSCIMHLGRAYYAMYVTNGTISFGETFCMSSCVSQPKA